MIRKFRKLIDSLPRHFLDPVLFQNSSTSTSNPLNITDGASSSENQNQTSTSIHSSNVTKLFQNHTGKSINSLNTTGSLLPVPILEKQNETATSFKPSNSTETFLDPTVTENYHSTESLKSNRTGSSNSDKLDAPALVTKSTAEVNNVKTTNTFHEQNETVIYFWTVSLYTSFNFFCVFTKNYRSDSFLEIRAGYYILYVRKTYVGQCFVT